MIIAKIVQSWHRSNAFLQCHCSTLPIAAVRQICGEEWTAQGPTWDRHRNAEGGLPGLDLERARSRTQHAVVQGVETRDRVRNPKGHQERFRCEWLWFVTSGPQCSWWGELVQRTC